MACPSKKNTYQNEKKNNDGRETFGNEDFSVSYNEQAKEDFQFWLSIITVAISIFALTKT